MLRQVAEGVSVHRSELLRNNTVVVEGSSGVLVVDPGLTEGEMACLAEDLRDGTAPFRRGAAMVKELYFGGTGEVVGWSVMRKVRARSAGGSGWFFFESLDGRRAIARGRGVGVCVGCHRDGTDFLLSEFRP